MDIAIPRERLTVSFSRSGGPGGQNVNKVASKAEIRFTLAEADWIPPPVRDRLAGLFPSRLNRDGEFLIVSSRFRDQGQNLRDCEEKLQSMLRAASRRPKTRVATRPTRASKHAKRRTKEHRTRQKRERGGTEGGPRSGTDEW